MKTVMTIHKKIRYNTSFAHFSSCLEWFSALDDDDHTFYEGHQNKYITLTRGHWINSIVVGDRINGHPTNAHLHVLRLHGSSWTTTGRRHLLTSLRPAACLPASLSPWLVDVLQLSQISRSCCSCCSQVRLLFCSLMPVVSCSLYNMCIILYDMYPPSRIVAGVHNKRIGQSPFFWAEFVDFFLPPLISQWSQTKWVKTRDKYV